MLTLNEKLNLISELEAENLSESLIEDIVELIENPEDPVYVCNTPQELTAALTEMSMGDSDENN